MTAGTEANTITPLQVRKRDGNLASFDEKKIHQAVYRCMTNGLGESAIASGMVADEVTGRVMNILSAWPGPFEVEAIQDLVEQQLMAAGAYDAARAYILYREERAKLRDEVPIPDHIRAKYESDKQYFRNPIQQFQFYDKYSRWNAAEGRRETWGECATRAISFMQEFDTQGILTLAEWQELRESFLGMEAMPSMRLVQMAGPAARRCNVGIYNCAFLPIDSLTSWSELLYILMQGTGCGFSVEDDYVAELPRVKKLKKDAPVHQYQIPDDTEGWCDALAFGVKTWFDGEDVEFDYTRIRPKGTRLQTKGGVASGPDPLKELLNFAREVIRSRAGRVLTAGDCHRIACMCGQIVQVGGVRRAAEISLSDLHDAEMRTIKSGDFYGRLDRWGFKEAYLEQANNSAVYEEKPDDFVFLEEWLALMKSYRGERGIFNRQGITAHIPKRRKKRKFGINPCGEIVLRARQFCNLSIACARQGDTREDLLRKVRLAARFGTLQSLMTNFRYIPEGWKKNSEEERLLGVDITGELDCELLQPKWDDPQAEAERALLLEELKAAAVEENRLLALRLGIPQSAAVTCVKPGGNSAQLLYCASGLSPRLGKYIIRRCRAGAYTALAQVLKDAGVPWHPEIGEDPKNPSRLVFEFVIEAPEGSVLAGEMTAIQQLENWRIVRQHYTEHNPSVTIYVGNDEWLEVGNWVLRNWDWVGGLSFLPRNDHQYQLAPNEVITQEEYERRLAAFPEVDYSKLLRYETDDETTGAREFACTGDKCEL